MCLYPKIIKNRKYIANKKNGGVIPLMPLSKDKNENGENYYDERVLYVPVGCGKCMECMKKKAREWQVRLSEELKSEKMKPYFMTLTFSNESIKKLSAGTKVEGYELDNYIAKKAMRKFLERWRKKYKKSLKHWFVTELGGNGTENIHLHGIVFTDEEKEDIDKMWGYGHTWTGEYVSEQTINYIIKYIHKTDEKHTEYKPIILTSPRHWKGIHEDRRLKKKQLQKRWYERILCKLKRIQNELTTIFKKQNIYRRRKGKTMD